ncbi:MAG TPA: SIMPL domain-containing protein [Verrucomicrobiae bacterium]|nr:SIMPL domain-containing protein [Verrucomicrobiae bacterium]
MSPEEQTPKTPKKLSITLDARTSIIVLLLVVITSMAFVWKPWDAVNNTDQTITVTGESTVTAEPDEYVFTPSYQFVNANKDAALAELTKKSETIVTELKKLGVQDGQIKTNANGNNYYTYSRDSKTGNTTYTFRPTVTLRDKELTQKVQDYLVTTSPTGAITPQADFSDAKRKELQNKARDEATKEARTKADQSAKNLGFRLGKVQSVNDGSGFDNYPVSGGAEALIAEDTAKRNTISVQPGENKLNYSVTVVYFVK